MYSRPNTQEIVPKLVQLAQKLRVKNLNFRRIPCGSPKRKSSLKMPLKHNVYSH